MRALMRFAAVLAAAAIGLLALATTASAHAVVVGSTPVDGSRLQKSPTSVTVRFDESVGLGLGYLRVVDSSGKRVDTGTASHPNGDGTQITVSLKSGLGEGSYLASFRIISADSHPVAGSIRWVVGNGALGAGGGPSDSAPVNQAVSSALATSHWLSFAGVGAVGGSWLIFSVWPAGRRRLRIRRLIWIGWTLAVAGALGEFLLEGPYQAGSGLGSVLRGTLLDATLHANTGQLLSVRLVLLGVLGGVLTALFGTGRRPSWAPEVAAMVGVGIVVTFAASGHAQSANPRWLAVLIDALHLSAMIIWLGGLLLLSTAAWGVRRPPAAGAVAVPERQLVGVPAEASPADASVDGAGWSGEADDEHEATGAGGEHGAGGERGAGGAHGADDEQGADADELAAGLPIFSRVALACVVVLAVTGTIQAWREVKVLDALTATRYGQLVIVKVALFLALVGLGYLSRRVLQRPVEGRSTLSRLRRTIGLEVLVGAVVLAVTGVLIAQPPGDVALAAQRGKPRQVTVQLTQQARAIVEVAPGVHGAVQFTIQLVGPIKPTTISASASLPARDLGPIPLPLQVVGPNSYSASGVLLPAAGQWQVTVTVQTSDFDSTTALATIKVY
jgi:copper transport protein